MNVRERLRTQARQGAAIIYVQGADSEVLKEQFVTVWPKHGVHFHKPGDNDFRPEDTEEFILGGGVDDLERSLDNAAAMQAAGKRTVMLGLGLGINSSPKLGDAGVVRAIIDAMALRTVRDFDSAELLRAQGLKSAVCVCADLRYLRPHTINTHHDFREADVRIATHLRDVILCVLENTPFVAVGEPGGKVQRECSALNYPLFFAKDSSPEQLSAAAREAWSERSTLKELLADARPKRIRLAERNMELLRSMPPWGTARPYGPLEAAVRPLVIWAASDEFWNEAQHRIEALGSIDCLVPANSRLKPQTAAKRFSLPAGTLMHWEMMPAEIKNEIEHKYEAVVLCHTSNEGAASHLSQLAARAGARVWEYGLWTDNFKTAKEGQWN